ncbi:MAG: AraC family transcriptional regulator [Bacillota bacterium]
MLDIQIDLRDSIELNVYHCGIQQCERRHSFGPAVRDHFLIHYVLDGTGMFRTESNTYSLGKAQGFLICPGQVTYYEADADTPWAYAWVGFHGMRAQHYLKLACLDESNPIFTTLDHDATSELLKQMVKSCTLTRSREIRLRGYLYQFLAHLVEAAPRPVEQKGQSRAELYVQEAVKYIQLNYSEHISVNEVARHVGVDRSYLCALFRQVLGTSPQEFIIRFRIEKSRELMKDARLGISDIARSVGYENPSTFSKAFRRVLNVSPSHYRQEHCLRRSDN